MKHNIVIVGAGQAAASCAERLRALDDKVEITLIGAEPMLPYQRPPLSKKYMTGEMAAERLLLRPADWYEVNRIACRIGVEVAAIDRDAHSLTLTDGEKLPYDRLVLATGARPRLLAAETGGALARVFPMRTIADADHMRALMIPGCRLLIVGGGYIGLEAAAVATKLGANVEVIELADRILQRVACAATSDYFRTLHRENGVTIHENTGLERLEDAGGKAVRAYLADGNIREVDAVLLGIGVIPESRLAEKAGLCVENGIAVDLCGQTSDPDIFACGDCASFAFQGNRLRLESVQNAIDQAHSVAENLLGQGSAYEPVPWFWSDQYDVKLQIAGLNTGYDETVLRPGPRPGSQSVWYFRSGRFVAVDAMNDPKSYMVGKKMLEAGKSLTPKQAADGQLDLKALLEGQARYQTANPHRPH